MVSHTLLLILLFLFLLTIGAIYFIYASPRLSPAILQAIKDIQKEGPPELVHGQVGIAQSGAIKIWYEIINPMADPKGTILLVMGHSTSGVRWPTYLYQPMIDAGYQVIRYDNRGLGKSDWIKDWTKKTTYTLSHMAADGRAVLDAVGIEKAHLFGVSMGGMIAQQMTIDYPTRVASLTSIMSTGYMDDPELPYVPRATMTKAVKLGIRYRLQPSEESFLKYAAGATFVLRGNDPAEVDVNFSLSSNLYLWRKHGGYNVKVGDQHTAAIKASGARYEALKQIDVPTLVIHGDGDPLVPVEHSKKYAPMIPNAKLVIIDKMSHRLPVDYMSQIIPLSLENFEKGALKQV